MAAGPLSDLLPAGCVPAIPAAADPGHAADVLHRHLELRGLCHLHALLLGMLYMKFCMHVILCIDHIQSVHSLTV